MGLQERRCSSPGVSRGRNNLLLLSSLLFFFTLVVVSSAAESSNFRYLKPHEVESLKIKRSTDTTDPESVAREVLHLLAPENGHLPRDIDESRVTDLHSPDSGFGPIIVRFERIVDDLPVWGTRVQVALHRETLDPVVVSGSLPASHRVSSRVSASLSAEEAFSQAINSHHNRRDLSSSSFVPSPSASTDPSNPYQFLEFPEDGSLTRRNGHVKDWPSRIRYRPVWYASHENEEEALQASFYAELGPEALLISAIDGRILLRYSIFHNATFSYRVWARTTNNYAYFDGPQGDGYLPSNSGTMNHQTLAYTKPNLVTLNNAPFSRNDPWLPSGATVTTGNNVDAYADLKEPDGFSAGDLRATVTSSSKFDRVYDVTKEPDASKDQIQAAVTQLFYTVNWLHDWFYDAGFDEKSGNAQQNNFGRGGRGGDRILAEGQDYSGINNANTYTPADGESPVIQMYKWDGFVKASVSHSAPSAAKYTANYAEFGPRNFDLSGGVVLVTEPKDPGCQKITAPVKGKIAIIDRGGCATAIKTANAQAAGAIGVIFPDILVATTPPVLPASDEVSPEPTIPVVSLTMSDGTRLKKMLQRSSGLTVTIKRASGIRFDGTISNFFITHEWGHVLTNRLVPKLESSQSLALGEGWSDFIAMLTTVQASDASIRANSKWTGTFGLGAYVNQAQTTDAVYFGARRYPYSIDMKKNPLTFKHISSDKPLPKGVPFFDNGFENSEPHNAGEVWGMILWECYAALLRDTSRLKFDQAQQRMKNYLVASLKMTPANPTFIEARDALLAVAKAADPNDEKLFCQAFAKRGMGTGAKAPGRDSTDFKGVVESFKCGSSKSSSSSSKSGSGDTSSESSPTDTSSNSSPSDKNGDDASLSSGAIVGIVLGSVGVVGALTILFALVGVVVFIIIHRRRQPGVPMTTTSYRKMEEGDDTL